MNKPFLFFIFLFILLVTITVGAYFFFPAQFNSITHSLSQSSLNLPLYREGVAFSISSNSYQDNKDGSFSLNLQGKTCTIRIGAEVEGSKVDITKKDFKLNINQISSSEIYYNFSFIPDITATTIKVNNNNLIPIVTLEDCDERYFAFNFADIMNDYDEGGTKQAWIIRNVEEIKATNIKKIYLSLKEDYNLSLSDKVVIDPTIRLFFSECLADSSTIVTPAAGNWSMFSKWSLTRIPANSNITRADYCIYNLLIQGSAKANVSLTTTNQQGWEEGGAGYITLSTQTYTNHTIEPVNFSVGVYTCINITKQFNASYVSGDKNFTLRVNMTTVSYTSGNTNLNLSNRFSNFSFEDRDNSNNTGKQPYLDVQYSGTNPDYLEYSFCQNLLTPNMEYRQIQNIVQNANADCIVVSAQNITVDCQGYTINSTKNFTAIYSNQPNTTIKNCNITTMGSGGHANAIGIEFVAGANRSRIFNNSVTGDTGAGIQLSFASNNNITNNNVKTIRGFGIYISSSSINNTATTNIAFSNNTNAFYVINSNGNTLTNNNATSNQSTAIIILQSNNDILTGNNGTSFSTISGSIGIIVQSGVNNSLTNNYGYSQNRKGINFNIETNSTLKNSLGQSASGTGIELDLSVGIIMLNNSGISNSGNGMFLSLTNSSNLTDNTAYTNISNQAFLLQNSKNNIITRQTAIGNNTLGMVFTSSNNTIIQDCINITGETGDVFYVTTTSFNNTFINCSYRTTENNETVLAGGSLIRKWYYRAYVNDSTGTAISGARINATNVSGTLEFSILTNGTGWTNITTITDYTSNGTRTYYNPYSLIASNITISTNHTFNASNGNNLTDYFTLEKLIPSLTITSSAGWNFPAATYSTITGVGCPVGVTCNLFENNVGITNPFSDNFAGGIYYFIFNTTGNDYFTNGTSIVYILNSMINSTGFNGTIGGTTTTNILTPICRYKKFGYWNPKLPWLKETNCI